MALKEHLAGSAAETKKTLQVVTTCAVEASHKIVDAILCGAAA